MAFAESADFGQDSLFLLQQHAPGFKIADLGDHGTLHYGATLVVLDVAHPLRFIERDLFGEALFFEVTDGVVVGVGQEVLDRRCRFDVVL